MELADHKPVCPRYDGVGAAVKRVSYIEVIYDTNECPRCNHRWRSVYHYIGTMEDVKDDFVEENKELMKVIKSGSKKLKEKYKNAPADFKG
jgi:DNA polymerase/3'-5' exonuclease PolX